MSCCICGGYLGSKGADSISGIRWCRCASPKMTNLVTQSGISVTKYNKELELLRKEIQKMNKTYTVTINNLTESDMRDIFYEAVEKLGVKAGEKIPSDMVDLREAVIKLMFEVEK